MFKNIRQRPESLILKLVTLTINYFFKKGINYIENPKNDFIQNLLKNTFLNVIQISSSKSTPMLRRYNIFSNNREKALYISYSKIQKRYDGAILD